MGRGKGKGSGKGEGANQHGVVISQQAAANLTQGNPNVRITFKATTKEKSIVETFILTLALGLFGAHHFYLGRIGFGFAYLFTFGLLGVGYVADLFRVPCLVSQANRKIREPQLAEEKSTFDAYVLWFPCGFLGFHHFYLKNYGLGLLYLFTFGIFGIGWLIDAVRIPFMVDEVNRRVHNADPTLNDKSVFDGYLFALSPLGILGGHHYYLNRPLWGVLYTFTLGLFGVGWVFDWFRIPFLVKRANEARHPVPLTQTQVVNIGDKKYLDDAYILLFPFGFTGLHHFYLKRYGWGVLYLFTFGILGIGYLIDYCRLPCLVSDYNKAREQNRRIVTNLLGGQPTDASAVITVTSTVPQGGMPGSVMQPPPQVWQPSQFTNYPQQYGVPAQGGLYPSVPQQYQPPSYIEAMGNGTPGVHGYQTAIPPPGYHATAPPQAAVVPPPPPNDAAPPQPKGPAPPPPNYGSTDGGPLPSKNQ